MEKLAKRIKSWGYRVFLYKHDYSEWLSIITPNGSWMEIFYGDYGGFNITYEYVPSRDFGSGCRCNDSALSLYGLTKEVLEAAERYGKNFSSRTWHNEYLRDSQGGMHKVRVTGFKKPTHYANGYEALMNSYFGKRGDYVEV